MATSKTPVPAAPPAGGLVASATTAATSLIRLWVAAITLPLTTASTITASLSRLFSSLAASLGNAAAPQAADDIVKATSDVVNATVGLYISVLKAGVAGLDAATRAVSDAVNEATGPTRK
jgi:hypothetical protein